MTRQRSSAARSAKTATFVRTSPFRKGTVREKAFEYLRKPRTYAEFNRWAKRIGVNPSNLLRTLKKSPAFFEGNWRIWMDRGE